MISDVAPSGDAASPTADATAGQAVHAAPAAGDVSVSPTAQPSTPLSPLPPPFTLPELRGPPVGDTAEHIALDSMSVAAASPSIARLTAPPPAEATARQAAAADLSMNMTLEGERTLVEDEEEDGEMRRALRHVKGPSSSSLSLIARGHAKKASASSNGHAPQRSVDAHADPLRMEQDEEEEDVTAARTASPIQFREDGEESRPLETRAGPVRRASHLRVDIKNPPSPMPWEVVAPPLDNNDNLAALATHYSPLESHKFRTLQNSA